MGNKHGKERKLTDEKSKLDDEGGNGKLPVSAPASEEHTELTTHSKQPGSEIQQEEQVPRRTEESDSMPSEMEENVKTDELYVSALALDKEPATGKTGETDAVDTGEKDVKEEIDAPVVGEDTADPSPPRETGVRHRTTSIDDKEDGVLDQVVKAGGMGEGRDSDEPNTEPEFAEKSENAEKHQEQALSSAFAFWFFLAAASAVLAGIGIVVCRALLVDQRAEFLTMPPMVRDHYSRGQIVKIAGLDRSSLNVFVRSTGPSTGEVVVCVHGLASSSFLFRDVLTILAKKKIRALAIDLPGSGLSDKPETPVYDVHHQVQSLTKVLASLASPPVHLVAHDSGALVAAAYAAQNPSLVRSLTFIDTPMVPPFQGAFPAWLLNGKLSSQLVASSPWAMWNLLRRCCSNQITQEAAEAHAYLLRINGGLIAAGLALQQTNTSAAFADSLYRSAEGVLSGMEKQISWSGKWSRTWEEQGEEMAAHWPMAHWHNHEGGRWPQVWIPNLAPGMLPGRGDCDDGGK